MDEVAPPPFRSLLFSPGSSAKMLAKAQQSEADALIFDLEDAVAPHMRDEARRTVAEALAEPCEPAIFVRVNHPDTGAMDDDVAAVASPNLYGIVLPKADVADDVTRLDAALAAAEAAAGVDVGHTKILPLLESGRGLHFAYDVAVASDRVVGLAFSSGEEGDFFADLNAQWTPDGAAVLYPRSKTVCETRAAGLRWPVDGVCMQLGKPEVLDSECRLARRLGFQAKMAIHPSQIAKIHEVFTPSDEEIARQEAIVAAYRDAEARGLGAVQQDGIMIDRANVVLAERILARARGRRGAT